jgi:hypothetical protein
MTFPSIQAWHAIRKISASVRSLLALHFSQKRYFFGGTLVPCVLLLRALILPVHWFRASILPWRHAPSPWSSGQGLGRWMRCGSLGHSLRCCCCASQAPVALAPHQFPAVAPPHSSGTAGMYLSVPCPRKGGFASGLGLGSGAGVPSQRRSSSVGNTPFRLKQSSLPASRLLGPCC